MLLFRGGRQRLMLWSSSEIGGSKKLRAPLLRGKPTSWCHERGRRDNTHSQKSLITATIWSSKLILSCIPLPHSRVKMMSRMFVLRCVSSLKIYHRGRHRGLLLLITLFSITHQKKTQVKVELIIPPSFTQTHTHTRTGIPTHVCTHGRPPLHLNAADFDSELWHGSGAQLWRVYLPTHTKYKLANLHSRGLPQRSTKRRFL